MLVTKCCPRSDATLYYAVFLSTIDFGDTCSALVTDPLVASLGMGEYGVFTGIGELIKISAAGRAATALLVPFLISRSSRVWHVAAASHTGAAEAAETAEAAAAAATAGGDAAADL